MKASHSRLKEQGFVNEYRKPIFVLLVLGLLGYLGLVPGFGEAPQGYGRTLDAIGVVVIVAGIVMRVLATISIGGSKDKRIVKTEVYSITRNPLYFASFLMALGVGFVSQRLDFMILLLAGFLAIFFPMMVSEANYLRKRFPDYAEYEKRVPMFFPNPFKWSERQIFEIRFKLVKRTFLDASLVLLVVPAFIAARNLLG